MNEKRRLVPLDRPPKYLNSLLFYADIHFYPGDQKKTYTWSPETLGDNPNSWQLMKTHSIQRFVLIEHEYLSLEYTSINLRVGNNIEITNVPIFALVAMGQFLQPIRNPAGCWLEIDLVRSRHFEEGYIKFVLPSLMNLNEL